MTTWPLVGRAEELALLTHVLDSGESKCVVIGGPAGVGKSRLASELARRERTAGSVARSAVATQTAASVPFGALADLLPALTEGQQLDRLRLLQRAGRALSEGSDDGRVLLSIDDAHLLDDLSATLVHQLALAGSVALVLTVRSGERVPDSIEAIWKDGLGSRVDLQPLARRDVEEILESALAGRVDSAALDHLWSLSRGNALYLRELIAWGQEVGALASHEGVWRFTPGPGLGQRLVELVEARLHGLGDASRTAVEMLAIGEPISVTLLTRLVDNLPLDDLERRGIVLVESSERRLDVRLIHPLYAEVLRASTPTVKARRITMELATAVEDCGARRRGDLLRVAIWRLESGSAVDQDLLVRAANAANVATEFVLAERLAKAALDGEPSFGATLALAHSLVRRSRLREAAELLDVLDVPAPTDEARARMAIVQMNIYTGLHESERSLQALQDGADSIVEPKWRALVQAARSQSLLREGRTRESVEIGWPLLEDPNTDESVKLQLLNGAGHARWMSGRCESALKVATQCLPTAMRYRDDVPDGPGFAREVMVSSLMFLGRVREARETFASLRALYDPATPLQEAQISFSEGRIALCQGHAAEAGELLGRAADASTPFGVPGRAQWGHALLAEALALTGDGRGAADALARGDAGGPETTPYRLGDRLRAEAWVVALSGETSRGVSLMLDAAAYVRETEQAVYEVMTLHDAARLGAAEAVVERLRVLQASVDGAYAPAAAAHAEAMLAADAPALDDVSKDFEGMGMNLVAAEAAFQAAQAHRANGLIARAAASTSAGERLAGLCEGARTPALSAAAQPLSLTSREREIATLAAAALSNKEIADRLVLSVRTVEWHLQHAYAKLGIESREDLASTLGLG